MRPGCSTSLDLPSQNLPSLHFWPLHCRRTCAGQQEASGVRDSPLRILRLPFPPPGDLPIPGIKPRSPAFQEDSLPSNHWGSPSLALKNSHEIKRLYIQVVTPVLVDSFHLIPGTQVSGDKTLWAGKRYWKSRSNDKKMNKLKHGKYALFSILQKIVARKVSSYVAQRNCSQVIRGARTQMVRGWKPFRKHQKITVDQKITCVWSWYISN